MSVIKKLANVKLYERGANYELGHSLNGTAVQNFFGTGQNNISLREEFAGYVWKAINIRAENLSSQDFYVERMVGDKWQKDDNHEFNQVLEGVDGGNDLSELLEAHQTCMDMYGESFWYFSHGETSNNPFAVYILDPAFVTVLVSGETVTGYLYDKESLHISLDVEEVEHFRSGYSPFNRFRGVGPMQKAGWFIKSSRYVTTYINNFLENNAIPAGIIVGDTSTNDDDWKLFKEAWASKYSGIDNAGKTGFVRGDLKFEKTGLSLGEVDFEKVKDSSRNDILAMFSIPLSALGQYENFNKASAAVSDGVFAKTFTAPAIRKIERKLSRYVGRIYGEQFRFGSDFELPVNEDQQLAEVDKGVGRWMSVNEAREVYGLPKLGPEYDLILTQTQAPAQTPAKSLGKITIRRKSNGFSVQMKEDFRSQTEDIQLKYERKFLEASNKVLTDQKKRVLSQILPKKIVDAHLDANKEADQMVEAAIALELELALEQGNLATAFVTNPDVSFKLTPVMEKYIRDSLSKSALGFTEQTIDKVSTALAEGIQNGDTLVTIANNISKIYDEVLGVKTPGYRIERLARTEIIKTSNEITEAAYKQTGVVQKKEWLANPGACEFCQALNGNIVNLGGTYVPLNGNLEGVDGGSRVNDYESIDHPPAHSNCRCTLIPVVEGI